MIGLDNPVWTALTTVQARFAISHGGALRYPAEVAPFLAVEGSQALTAETLDALVGDGLVYLLGPRVEVPPPWQLESLGTIVQMICERRFEAGPVPDAIRPLGDADRPAVLALAALVYPHFFRPRTPELGRYHGIAGPGWLDAMIGERMAMPGLREISAVCTHPDCVGRGLARCLLAHASNAIFDAGETPFLHVSPSNTRAVELYERNHYRRRIDLSFWSLTKSA